MPDDDGAEPANPNARKRNAVYSGVLGVSLGVAALCVRDGLDDSIHGNWLLTLCWGTPLALCVAAFALVRLFENER